MADVLVVEDDADLVYIYRTALAQAGHQVTMARSGPEAREALAAAAPDLIFLDMNIPGESGVSLIEHIRSTDRFQNTRIVVVTANQLMQRQIDRDDIAAFLVKPVSIFDLVQMANRLTE